MGILIIIGWRLHWKYQVDNYDANFGVTGTGCCHYNKSSAAKFGIMTTTNSATGSDDKVDTMTTLDKTVNLTNDSSSQFDL